MNRDVLLTEIAFEDGATCELKDGKVVLKAHDDIFAVIKAIYDQTNKNKINLKAEIVERKSVIFSSENEGVYDIYDSTFENIINLMKGSYFLLSHANEKGFDAIIKGKEILGDRPIQTEKACNYDLSTVKHLIIAADSMLRSEEWCLDGMLNMAHSHCKHYPGQSRMYIIPDYL